MDCDMLCRGVIAGLWALRDDRYAVMVVLHEHVPPETAKFLGEVQSPYPRKNRSSLVLFNCGRCRALTPAFVNEATGLEAGEPALLHWTLGGPWFREQRLMGGVLAAEWFAARDDVFRRWD